MSKGRREFFEVFRRVPEKDRPTGWWPKRQQPPPAEKVEGDAAQPAEVKPKSDGRINFSISQEMVAILAVALVAVLVGSNIWSYSRGAAQRKDPAPEVLPGKATDAPTPKQPERPAFPYFTLALTPEIAPATAKEICADLRAMNYDAFVLQSKAGGLCTVNVGRFADWRTRDAKEYKEKINSLVYRNKKFFASCGWVQVTGKGSVER